MTCRRCSFEVFLTNVALTTDRGWERLPRGTRWSKLVSDLSALRMNAYWTSTQRWSLKSAERLMRLRSETFTATITLACCNAGITVDEVNALINVHSSGNCWYIALTKVNVCNDDMQNTIFISDPRRRIFTEMFRSFTCKWRNVVVSGGVAMMASKSLTQCNVTRR